MGGYSCVSWAFVGKLICYYFHSPSFALEVCCSSPFHSTSTVWRYGCLRGSNSRFLSLHSDMMELHD